MKKKLILNYYTKDSCRIYKYKSSVHKNLFNIMRKNFTAIK